MAVNFPAVTFRCKDVNSVLYVFFSKMYLIEYNKR